MPIPPQLTALLQQHIAACGTAPGGGCSAPSAAGYCTKAPTAAPGTSPAPQHSAPALAATPLARQPYDLRHAALSLWLASGAPPAEIAARAGDSTHVLLTV